MAAADRTTSVEYRTIARHCGFRFGSDAGVQTSWTRGVSPKMTGPWRALKPQPRPTGYSWVYLGSRGVKPNRLDEVLCEAFHGERPPGTECLHRDGDRSHCVPSNLYWGIAPENIRDPSVEYRRIPECGDGYEFGADGSCWSAWDGSSPEPGDTWHRIKGTLLDSGHIQVAVKWDGVLRRFGAHHLICLAFHGPCPEGMECCHGDGIPSRNTPDNLRWGTPKDNAQDQIKHGVFVRGERHWSAVLNKHKVRAMRDLHAGGMSVSDIARRYEISWTSADRIVKRKTWKHVS